MKIFKYLVLLILLIGRDLFCADGEIMFFIEDNSITTYKITARRINPNNPSDLYFGENFIELGDDHSYDFVISDIDVIGGSIVWGDYQRGFDYLRHQGSWPLIGEGILEFSIYRGNSSELLFKFTMNTIHCPVYPVLFADMQFRYTLGQNYVVAVVNQITTYIYFGDSVPSWALSGQSREIIRYTNPVELSNDVNGNVENDIRTTFNSAVKGFPYGGVQLGIPINPGTIVRLWRGVNYNISTSHSTYTKNNIIYNFRNWIGYETYTTSATLRILAETDEFRSMYYTTIPLTVANNLEGGSSNNDYEIT
jgi:hypothetical protein